MKLSIPGLLLLALSTLGVQSAQANSDHVTFKQCMDNRLVQKGALQLIVDPTLFEKPDDVFEFLNSFQFFGSWGFGKFNYEVYSMGINDGWNYETGEELNPRSVRVIELHYDRMKDVIDSATGLVNQDWLEAVNARFLGLQQKYRAIIRTQCVHPVPGGGTRVGG